VESTAITPLLVARAFFEVAALFLIAVFLLTKTDIRKRLFPMGAAGLSFLFIFIGAWGVVQAVDRWQYEYPQPVSFVPLTRFAMYQVQLPESVTKTYAWDAEAADGTPVDVNFAEEFEAVGLPPLSMRMTVLLEELEKAESPQDQEWVMRELSLWAKAVQNSLADRGIGVESIRLSEVHGTPADNEATLVRSWSADELEVLK